MSMTICRIKLYIMIVVVLFHPCIALANKPISVHEVLSINTGKKPDNIGNQFMWANLEPFNGFGVDSKGNILISDTKNHRIMRFSKEAKLPDLLTANDSSLFLPDSLCLTGDDSIYTHNPRKQEIIVFSPSGKTLRSYRPGSVLENNKKRVPIISLTCGKATIKIAFGIQEPKTIRPVYEDEYDQQFKLVSRKVYNDQVAYYNALEESSRTFEKHFEDSKGYMYGYPIVKDWYGKFLPLQKYSSAGVLLITIDGKLLTEYTRYKVFDYYTTRNIDWTEMKGSDFMIVNWHVTSDGTIYVLLANRDHVKVLRIEE